MTSEEESTKEELVLQLKAAIEHGIKLYLHNTSFGISSLWVHGQTGLQRADRLSKIIKTQDTVQELVSTIMSLFKGNGHTLKRYVSNSIFYSRVFPDMLTIYTDINEREMMQVSVERYFQDKRHTLNYICAKQMNDYLS